VLLLGRCSNAALNAALASSSVMAQPRSTSGIFGARLFPQNHGGLPGHCVQEYPPDLVPVFIQHGVIVLQRALPHVGRFEGELRHARPILEVDGMK
jgi:hypothetical protein